MSKPITASQIKKIAAVAREMQSTIEVEEDGRIIRVIPNIPETHNGTKIVPIQGPLM